EILGEGIAAVLDGPVRDTAGSVDLVGAVEGTGGAGVDAAGAGAAVVGAEGVVRREGDVHDEFADEEERAEVAVEEVGVLALPAGAGALRPRLVEDGG